MPEKTDVASQSGTPEASIALSEVLIAFQKSLARAQSQSAMIKRTPQFFLGERALLDIESLEVELKLGVSASGPEEDALKVHFSPEADKASMVRFRVKVKPTEMLGTGVVIMRPPAEKTEPADHLCIMTIAEGKAVTSKVNIHIASRNSVPSGEKATPAQKNESPKDGSVAWDPAAGTFTVYGVLTDRFGLCRVQPVISDSALILHVNDQKYRLEPGLRPKQTTSKTAQWFKNAVIWASMGSADSEIVELFTEQDHGK